MQSICRVLMMMMRGKINQEDCEDSLAVRRRLPLGTGSNGVRLYVIVRVMTCRMHTELPVFEI